MKLKSTVKYQIIDIGKPVSIFYFVLFCILVFGFTVSGARFVISGNVVSTTTGPEISGMELATVVFLFVCGLNSFKEFFRMFMQNGISRKTIFISRLITILDVCTGMAVIDKGILLLGKLIASISNRILYKGLFEMIYSVRADRISALHMHIDGFFFNLCLYLAAMTIGYFITIAFYRMNRIAKITVAVGVPMVLLNGLPTLDAVLLHGAVMRALVNAFTFAFGFQNGGNPYFGMVTLLLIAAVFSCLSWLMARRAVVKD